MSDSFNPKPIIQQDTSSIENKIEDKTLGPIYMVYRDNRNWEKYAPKIIDHIRKELGGQIEVQVFPRGTDEKEIEKWYRENEDKFGGKFMLTDDTCSPKVSREKFQDRYSLDSFLSDSNNKMTEEILKEAFGQGGVGNLKMEDVNDLKEVYTKIFKLALEKNSPKKVTFVEFRLGHHINIVNSEEAKNRTEKNDQDVLEFIKKCLLDAGYPEINISVVKNVEKITDPEKLKLMDNEWFFIDSHNPMQYSYADEGLKVFDPTQIHKTVVAQEDGAMEKELVSKINQNIMKIETPEDFVSLLPSGIGFFKILEKMGKIFKQINSEEKFIKIINYLIDLHKDDPMWKRDEFDAIYDVIECFERYSFPLNDQAKEQIKKRIEEVMNS